MAGGNRCLTRAWKSLFGRKQSSEAEARKVDTEKERVRILWGSGAMRDVLPAVFHHLPPRERFLVQRVSRLFEGTSEGARLTVGQLDLSNVIIQNDVKDFNFKAKILNPNAFDGITSLRLPDDHFDPYWSPKTWSISKWEYESRLKSSRRKYKEALSKLSLPTLKHVSLSTGPLTQSLLPFLRSHPSISSLELRLAKARKTDRHLKEVQMVAKGLSKAKIRQLTIYDDVEFFSDLKGCRTSLFANVEELSLYGVKLRNLDFLPDPSKLTSLHYEIGPYHRIMNASFLDQASGLRCLSLTSTVASRSYSFKDAFPIEIAKGLQGCSPESLHFHFLICPRETGHVRDIVETLTSGGETSKLAMSLQELTVRVSHRIGNLDISVFNTDAFLHFPRLHSLRLRMDTYFGRVPTLAERNALRAQPVFTELKRRLRVLEITALEVSGFH